MRWIVTVCAGAALLAGASAAFACEGTVQLLSDPFAAKSSLWSATTDFEVGNGTMSITTRADKSEKIFAKPMFTSVDACADVVVTETTDLAAAYVGLGFWMKDDANLYTFQITPDGYAGVYRLKKDKWTTLIKDKQVGSIVQGIGSVNAIRVVTVGKTASLYINGEKFETLSGSPPDGGQHVGFVVEGPAKTPASFEFRNINVTAPAE